MLQLESAPQQAPAPHSSALSLQHILFAVFRHKVLVITCTLLGLIAAAVEYRYYPSIYESQAKLLVRYIVERSSVDPLDGAPRSAGVDTVLGNEAEILQSWDLAVQVAEAVGVQQLASNPKSPSA
jgi:uncharacterized protein involved in exopolysaccharide biosynthesis